MKKHQFVNLGLIAGFFCCYTEWGQNRSMFIANALYEILTQKDHFWQNISHPLILSGFLGWFILLYCIAVPQTKLVVNGVGVLLLGLVVALFFLIGILDLNAKIILSTLPYLIFTILFFRWRKKRLEPLRT